MAKYQGVDKHGSGWRIRWTEPGSKPGDRRPQETGFPNAMAAVQRLRVIQGEIAAGKYVGRDAGSMTFRDYADRWLAEQAQLVSRSQRTYRSRLSVQVYPRIGDLPIGKIERHDLQVLANAIAANVGPRTTSQTMKIVSQILDMAVVDGRRSASPYVKINLPAHIPTDMPIPTVEQLLGLAEDKRLPVGLIMAIATTGLRRSELFAVTVDTASLNMLARTLTVRADLGQLIYEPGMPARLGPPKTKRARTIRLGEHALAAFASALAATPADPGDGFGGLVFRTPTGKPVTKGWWDNHSAPVFADHGFPPRARAHRLRHWYASALLEMMETAPTIRNDLGHASLTTLDTYAHRWPTTGKPNERTAIDGIFDRKASSDPRDDRRARDNREAQ